MRLNPFVRDYRGFMGGLTAVVDAPGTRFYLDTSLLMWLFRLGAAAREEYLDWCEGRMVKVPVWAAHERHHHLVANAVGANVRILRCLGSLETLPLRPPVTPAMPDRRLTSIVMRLSIEAAA